MKELILFTVKGSGEFPFDMLRYDCCWPRCTDDIAAMLAGRGKREIRLATYSRVTHARWVSFNWNIVDMRTL